MPTVLKRRRRRLLCQVCDSRSGEWRAAELPSHVRRYLVTAELTHSGVRLGVESVSVIGWFLLCCLFSYLIKFMPFVYSD
jgi:hypothetical protein